MKEGWSYKKLGEVCDFEGGSQPPKSEWINHPQDGYVRMLQIRDFTRSRNAEIEYVKISKKIRLCKADDILIGRYGASVGKILTGLAGAYNVAIIKSIPNEELISKAFIKRYFEARSFQGVLLKVCASRAAQAGFSKDDICDTPIPVPPLSEQHSIVSRLDTAFSHIDALKANAEKQLNEARKLFHVELTECMKPQEGWEERKLGEVCEVISGQSPEGKYYNTDGQGTPFYQGKKEFSFKYIGEPTMWTTAETKIATKGDLLMSVRAPVGDVNFATQRLCIGRGLAAIRTKEEIDKEYLFYYLVGKKSCIKGKEGVGFASINRKEIMDIGIQYPEDLSAQHSIVSHLDSLSSTIRKLEELQQKTLAECDALKQAMLREVFE